MLDATSLKSSLSGLIGWKQSEDQANIQLSSDLLVSDSGNYYQQAHPLLTLQNLKAIAPDFNNIVNPAWAAGTSYKIGNIVTKDTKHYIALTNNLAKDPATNATDWAQYDAFSYWLKEKSFDSSIKAIYKILNEKLAVGAGKGLVENKILFDGAGRVADVDLNSTGIVGFELVPARYRSLAIRINRLGLQFTGPTTNPITLYIFHSGSKQVYKTVSLTRTTSDNMQWFADVDILLPYLPVNADAGGSWYICYDMDLLPEGVYPIIKTKDWSSAPCNGCDSAAAGFNMISKYVEVYPFRNISGDSLSTPELWDISNNVPTNYNNHGLNLEMSIICDYTDFVVTQKSLFTNVFLLQFAVDMLKEMVYNPNTRINRSALLAQRAELMYALDGDSTSFKKSGLNYDLELAYKAISVNTMGIDKVCLPCKNGGIKYRTV